MFLTTRKLLLINHRSTVDGEQLAVAVHALCSFFCFSFDYCQQSIISRSAMLNSSQEQIVTKSLMQFRNRVVLLLNFLKFFHQFAALKLVYFMEICIFNHSLLSPAPIHCKILCSVRENGIVVALHTYFRLNIVLAGARLLFRLKNSRHQKEEKEAFDTEHRKIAIGLKQSRATDEMIVQVWQRVQHERFVPCCTPSFSCRLEKHPPATNPAQVETRTVLHSDREGGDPHEADVAIAISPRANYLFPATNGQDRLIPIRSAGRPIGDQSALGCSSWPIEWNSSLVNVHLNKHKIGAIELFRAKPSHLFKLLLDHSTICEC